MSLSTAKVLFFTAGQVPTVPELAAVARLLVTYRNVYVRVGAVSADTVYAGGIEPCDAVAGFTGSIPAIYTDSPASKTVLAVPTSVAPDQFKLFPAALTIDASNVDVQQMVAIIVTIDTATGLAKATDVSADAKTTYASSDATKATIGATGVLTAVAAGSTTITATYTDDTPLTGGTAEADDNIITKAAHGYVTGDAVKLVSLTNGTGLTAGTTYFVIKLTADTYKFATTFANAIAGTAVDVTVDGTSLVTVKAPQTSTAAITVAA